MVAIFRQDMLRQSPPSTVKATPEPPKPKNHGRQKTERVKKLPEIWNDLSKSAEEIAKELGFSGPNAVYQAAWRLNLPRRYPRGSKQTLR